MFPLIFAPSLEEDGIGKKDLAGNPISLDSDARSIVLGLTWRKVVFKATLALDRRGIRERFGDQQLALTKAGADIMLHAARAWVTRNLQNTNVVLLQKDVRNAFNELKPQEFLRDCRDHAPASARFAHFCYGASSHLTYAQSLEASNRGQQGCPLMGPMFCLTRKRFSEQARANSGRPAPEFEVEFADDAYSGGDLRDVLAAFKAELHLAASFGLLHFDLSKCTLYLLAGEAFRGDISEFQALGVRVVIGADLVILKTPVHGTEEFFDFCLLGKERELRELADGISRVPKKHVAFHLLQQCLSYGKIQYWTRTAPRRFLYRLLELHSNLQRTCLEDVLATTLTEAQWAQARLPAKRGGLGLLSTRYEKEMRVLHLADLSFLVSRRQVLEYVRRLLPWYDARMSQHDERTCIEHISPFFPSFRDEIRDSERKLDQKTMMDAFYQQLHHELVSTGTLGTQIRLRGVAAQGASAWVQTIPSSTKDTIFSNAAFSDVVGLRLGVSFFAEGVACSFCGQAMDEYGHHILGCLRQGSKYGIHNSLRNTIHRDANLAALQPKLEPTGLLSDDPQARPADTLLVVPPGVRQNSWRKFPRIAVDVAVTSPYQQASMADSTQAEVPSATRYAERKRQN